ncbi:hypothetical protein JL721_9928 [Aureococcus anophagefferens]|nr:hypothetical protein JL721_9928 [Aureococcus anophagefferens]
MATRVLAVSVALCAAASHAFVVPKARVAPTTLNGKDSDVEELVSASMYGSAADVASKALALADRTAAAEKGVEKLEATNVALETRAEAAEQKLEATTVALERSARSARAAEREAEVEAIEAATAESMQARKRVAELEDALAALDRKLATATRDASAASERADAAQAEADASLKRDRAAERRRFREAAVEAQSTIDRIAEFSGMVWASGAFGIGAATEEAAANAGEAAEPAGRRPGRAHPEQADRASDARRAAAAEKAAADELAVEAARAATNAADAARERDAKLAAEAAFAREQADRASDAAAAATEAKLAETKLATEVGRTKLARADASEKGAKVVELEGQLASPAVLFRRLRVVLVARARAAAGRAKNGTISAARATGSAVGEGARATGSAVGRGAAKRRVALRENWDTAAARATRSAVSTDAAVKTLDAARADAARDDLPKNGAKGGAPQ